MHLLYVELLRKNWVERGIRSTLLTRVIFSCFNGCSLIEMLAGGIALCSI